MNDWLDYVGSGSVRAYAANGMINDVSMAHAYVSRKATNANNLKNQLDKYNTQLKELQNAKVRLTNDISTWESNRKNAASKGYALSASQKYEPKITEAKKKINEIENKIIMVKQTISNLNSQLNANTNDYETEAYVRDNQKNVENLRRQYQKYELQLNNLRTARANTQSEIDQMESARKSAASKGYALSASQKYEPKITAAKNKLKEIENKIIMVKQTLSNLNSQMNIASTKRR